MKVLNPNAILVELCRQRVSLLELDDKKFLEDAKNFDAQKIKLVPMIIFIVYYIYNG